MKNIRKVSMPAVTRGLSVVPDTLDEEKRTVDVTISTGAEVKRLGFFEDFIEELDISKKSIRMERLNSGAPLLKNHRFEDQIGVVESARISNGELVGTVRFSKNNPQAEEVFRDVQDGIIRNVSVGYRIHKFEEVGEKDGLRHFRATDWEPFEVSSVPSGADNAAGFRSLNMDEKFDCEIIGREQEMKNEIEEKNDDIENEIDNNETRTVDQPNPEPIREEPEMDKEKLEKDARLAERKRSKEFREICRSLKIGEKLADEHIDKDTTVDEFRKIVIEQLAKEDSKEENTTRNVNVSVGEDISRNSRIEGMTEILMHRHDPTKNKITDVSQAYYGMRMIDLCREVLRGNNMNPVGMNPMQIAKRALGTSDLPELAANVANRTLRAAYSSMPRTFTPFVREVSVPDFKQIKRVQLGEAPNLELVPESGEVNSGKISDLAENYNVEDYAKILPFTRRMIINDDLAALTRIPSEFGRSAARLESDLVWAQITSNPTMANGNALFSAGNSNIITSGAAPDVDQLSDMRTLMRQQKGLDGDARIDLQPSWIVVPVTLQTEAEKLVTPLQPEQAANVNPFSARLQVIAEPRLDDASALIWYLFSDVGQSDMIELARLEGEDGPVIESEEGFEVEGIKIKARHTVAAKVLEHRAMVRNAGA